MTCKAPVSYGWGTRSQMLSSRRNKASDLNLRLQSEGFYAHISLAMTQNPGVGDLQRSVLETYDHLSVLLPMALRLEDLLTESKQKNLVLWLQLFVATSRKLNSAGVFHAKNLL